MTDKTDVFDPTLFEDVTADTADMVVKHPVTGEPTPWVITFAGPGHPQQKALSDRLMRKALREQQDRERARVNGRKYTPEGREPDEVRRQQVETIVDQIVTWTGCTVAFSRDEAIRMFSNPAYGKVIAQIGEFLDSEQVFTKRSATT